MRGGGIASAIRRVIILLGVVCTASLSGCAHKSDYQLLRELSDLELKLCTPFQEEYVCTVGIGGTLNEAERNAKRELAERVISVVSVRFEKRIRQVVSYVHEDVSEEVKQVKEFMSTNLAYLEFRGNEIFKTGKVSTGETYYYVAMKIKKERAIELHKKFARKVDVFAYIDLLESTDDLGVKARLLKELSDISSVRDLYEEKVVVKGDITTVGGFISAEKEAIRGRLRVAYTGERIYIVDAFGVCPVQALELLLEDATGREHITMTSQEGSVELSGLGFVEPIRVYARLANRWEFIAYLRKKRSSNVYIYTEPKGLYYELKSENQGVVSTGKTPNVINLTLKEGRTYKLKVFGSKVYGYVEKDVYVKPGYDAYVAERFERAETEDVELEVEGDATLTLETRAGHLIAEGEKGFKGRLAEGSYTVFIRHNDDSEEFQLVEDSFFLRKGRPVNRRYFEPEDRHFFKEGLGAYIAFSEFVSVPKDAKFSVENAPEDRDRWAISVFSFGGRRYFTYGYLGGSIGIASLSFKDSNSNSSGTGGYVDVVGGLYSDFWQGRGSWEVGVGYAFGKASYGEKYVPYRSEVSFALPFISFRATALFGLEIKVFSDSTLVLSVQIGSMGVRSGYRYPRKVNARAGLHYEEL
ncbi:hypothetical protein [Hydrogenivirga sp. 128-5-R1-1]|uniref:hypothetical protein n=1 Tax=Hydrogenivirga sp. 128-5-R1-1 TaxID=392423 RepID=UPI0012F87655|nr:hypothetical protein [Hydrogenivirga sp. 128-5-R1-1]